MEAAVLCVFCVYVKTIFMACQKPILMLLMKANFIALLFDFTAMPPGNGAGDAGQRVCALKCTQLKMLTRS